MTDLAPAAEHDDGDVTLKAGGHAISGWTKVRITRGIERCPNDFEVALTELYPDDAGAVSVAPGQSCEVLIGADPVITGYVDRFRPGVSATTHRIAATGRGKCQDLVDCSAEYPSGQIVNVTALQLAAKLAEPYGITVTSTGDNGLVVPQFNIMLGETGYEIVERVCRWAQLLAFEGADGNLMLAAVASGAHSTGLVIGQNVEDAEAEFGMDQRYSDYDCFLQSMQVLGDVGQGGNLLGSAQDPNVPRHRRKYMIAEAGGGGQDICKRRAQWEASRRAGRGLVITVKADSWRDGDGKLWTPNWTVPLDLPFLKLPADDYVIGEVTYVRDEDGTHAMLTIMPKAAFSPEPILLQNLFPDVQAPK